MTKVLKVRDERGLGIDYAQFEEVVHPAPIDIPRRLKAVKEFKYEHGDMVVCTFPKSGMRICFYKAPGTHWMTAMLHLLIHAKSREEIITGPLPIIPFIDLLSTRDIAALPRPRVIASHFQYHRLPAEHVQNGGKLILLLRNPKDSAVSLYYHLRDQDLFRNKESWDHYLRSYLKGQVVYGSFLDYVTSWSKVITEKIHTNIILVYYEDLVQDSFEQLKRIQDFLGTDRDEEILRLIAQRCSFGSLQNTVTAGKMPVVIRNSEGESILLRKGKVGDWKNHFTAEQSQAFDKACHARLKHTMFHFRYEIDTPKHKL